MFRVSVSMVCNGVVDSHFVSSFENAISKDVLVGITPEFSASVSILGGVRIENECPRLTLRPYVRVPFVVFKNVSDASTVQPTAGSLGRIQNN